jgi:hypothetical protein
MNLDAAVRFLAPRLPARPIDGHWAPFWLSRRSPIVSGVHESHQRSATVTQDLAHGVMHDFARARHDRLGQRGVKAIETLLEQELRALPSGPRQHSPAPSGCSPGPSSAILWSIEQLLRSSAQNPLPIWAARGWGSIHSQAGHPEGQRGLGALAQSTLSHQRSSVSRAK